MFISILILFLAIASPLFAQNQLVSVPSGIETDSYHVTGYVFDQNFHSFLCSDYYIEIAFDDNDVYMKGFFDRVPDGWLKGVRQGNLITFDNWQYLGLVTLEDGSETDAWMAATNRFSQLTLRYSEASGKMTLNDSGYPMLVAGPEKKYIEGCREFTIKKLVTEDDCDFNLITIPEDAEIQEIDIARWVGIPYPHCEYSTGQLAITGENIYIKGMLNSQKSSWIKGELIKDGFGGHIARFPVNQYLGIHRATFYVNTHVWFVGGIESCVSAPFYEILPYEGDYIDFIWDPEAGTLSYNWINEYEFPNSDEENIFLENATSASTICLLEIYMSIYAKTISTGLSDVKSDSDSIDGIFDINGNRQEKLHSGINIIRTEGRTKKILIP